jgi:hypothetical protein
MENKKVGISWQQISFLYAAFNLRMEVFFSLVEGRNEEVQNEKVASHGANFSCIVAFQVAEVFPPLFEGEMKKSQVENKTMGFHGAKVFFYVAIQIAV